MKNVAVILGISLLGLLAGTSFASDQSEIVLIESSHPDDIYWSDAFDIEGVEGTVYCMVEYRNWLVIGGQFSMVGEALSM